MRVLLTIALAAVISGCSENGRDITAKDRPLDEIAEIQRSDKELILDAILHDILNNPSLKGTREFYGTAGDRRLALVTCQDYGVPWPAGYRPILPGWTVSRVEEGAKGDPNQQRLLGVRIDKYFEQDKERSELFDWPIAVSIFNAGGSKNGDAGGGCSVYYTPKRLGGAWVVEFEALRDP